MSHAKHQLATMPDRDYYRHYPTAQERRDADELRNVQLNQTRTERNQSMNIDKAFPSNWIKAAELEGDQNFTIKKVSIETVGQGNDSDQKPCLFFHEVEKGLVLNKTNATTIKGIYGPDTDTWINKRITLFATEVDFAGKQTLAIRVRMRAPGMNGTGIIPPSHSGPAVDPKAVNDELTWWFRNLGLSDAEKQNLRDWYLQVGATNLSDLTMKHATKLLESWRKLGAQRGKAYVPFEVGVPEFDPAGVGNELPPLDDPPF